MKPTPVVTMVLTALVAGVACWVLFDLGGDRLRVFTQVPWTVPAALLTIAVGIVAAAWPVHQYVRGKRRRVDPLRSATVLALGKACALAGSGLVGAYAAVVLHVLFPVVLRGRIWPAAVAVAASLALAVAGRVVEWMCRLPPEDTADQAKAPGRPEPEPT
jgi:hypothetical protein